MARRRARWLTSSEEQAWRAYRRMRTLLDLQLGQDLYADSGLSESDYDVLSTLTEDGGPPWRARDLAARLLWSTSRLAHQVRRMEERGLVRREPYSGDRRGALIYLTDDGWAILRDAAPKHVESVRRHLIDLLEPADIDALLKIASAVIDHLAPGTTGAAFVDSASPAAPPPAKVRRRRSPPRSS